MTSSNYLELCRLCLVKDRASVPIFESGGDVRQILHKINTCQLPVKALREDKLPKKICDDCADKVESFYQFWNTTSNSSKQLLKLLDELSQEDKFDLETEFFDSIMMGQEQISNNGFDSALQFIEHHNTINTDVFNDMSIMTLSAENEDQLISDSVDTSNIVPDLTLQTHDRNSGTHLLEEGKSQAKDSHDWCSNEENLLMNEKGEKRQNNLVTYDNTEYMPCDNAVPTNLQQQTISETSETTSQQTAYSNAKTRMLEMTVLESVELLNLNAYPEPIHNPSLNSHEMSSPTSYLEDISNSTCGQIPSPALFLEHISESPALASSFFDEFPDAEIIADSELLPYSISDTEFIPHAVPSPVSTPPPLPFQELTSLPSLDQNANVKLGKKRSAKKRTEKEVTDRDSVKKLNKSNNERSRRNRQQHYCNCCLVGFTDKAKLGQHMVQEHQIEHPFTCEVCNKGFRSTLNINRHMKLHDPKPRQFSCDRCDYSTSQKSNLTLHIKRCHEKNYSFTCQECGAGFMQRTKFLEHQAVHQVQGRLACKYCQRTFSYKRNLRQHMVERHPETMPESFEPKIRIPCSQCNKQFVKEQSLQRHMKARHSEPYKKLPCDQCEALLSCKSALVQHMRSHSGEKVAVCDKCGKKFSKWQNLRVHERIHTGERPYACTQCTKTFTQRTSLVHHIRTHTGEKPYKCEQCTKKFVSGSLLKKHVKLVHNV